MNCFSQRRSSHIKPFHLESRHERSSMKKKEYRTFATSCICSRDCGGKHELGSFAGRDSFCSKAGTIDVIFQEMIAVYF